MMLVQRARSGGQILIGESRIVLQPIRLAMASRQLVRRALHPASVIVLPGLGGGDPSTMALRWYLQRIGHRVEGWELGIHGPQVGHTLDRFILNLESKFDVSGEPITLVGWSLGGVVAREAARDRPDLVSQVITFGSPISATHASARWIDVEARHRAQVFHDRPRRRRPIRVPVTTIYSRRDGVVNWQHALDRSTPKAVNVEVGSSHLGLAIDPDVWRIIADTMDRCPAP